MTIKNAVRKATAKLQGNKFFNAEDVMDQIDNMPDRPEYSRDSINRAMREQRHLIKISNGVYRIRGRRVV